MDKSTILAGLLALPMLVASGCREKCQSYELRYGDNCILKPDSGILLDRDAAEEESIDTLADDDASTEESTGDAAEPDDDAGKCAMQADDCDDDPDACLNTLDGYKCRCPKGYEGPGQGAQGCVDIDECAGGAVAACGTGATACADTNGSYECSCADGYSGTGSKVCVDIDECARGALAVCGAGATACSNTPGSYTCTCGAFVARNPDGRGCRLRTWGEAILIETDNAGSASNPKVGVDRTGNAVAVWLQSDGTRVNVWSSRYVAGGSWGKPTLIEADNTGDASNVALAVDGWGNAVAVWIQFDGTRDNVWANRRAIGGSGSWDTARLIETDNAGNARGAALDVDDAGNAVAVWCQSDGTRYNLWTNRYAANDSWGTAKLIESDNAGDADSPRVAIDGSGNALAFWSQSDGTRTNIWANRWTAAGSWGTATLIESDNAGNAYTYSVKSLSVGESGDAIAVWYQHDGTRHNIWANHFRVGDGRWGTATQIENNNAGDAVGPVVAMNDSGNALALWYQSDGTVHSIWANRYAPEAGWGTPTLVENDDTGYASQPAVAVDGSGNAVVAWNQSDGERLNMWSNRYVAGAGWGTPTLIERNDRGSASLASLAMDGSGNVVVVWYQTDDKLMDIWANHFR